MFGFSLPKLLFTILIIAIVWYGFKMIGRLDERRKEAAPSRRAPAQRKAATQEDSAQDLVACARCGTFVTPENPRSCGRADCPYPG